jgi:protein SCO1/2
MTTRTYALVMTTLSFIGLVTMLVAMSAMRQEREVNAEQILGEFVMEQDGLPILGNVTDFQLQDQSGAMMSLADMEGKVWVVDFIFTSCAGVCPKMSRSMATLQRDFEAMEDVHFVSITVDPERDSPEVLTTYAAKYEANHDQWHFLTGSKADIKKLSTEGFFIGFGDEMINHSSKFTLVDRQGNLRGFYTGTEPEEVDRLRTDIETLRAE